MAPRKKIERSPSGCDDNNYVSEDENASANASRASSTRKKKKKSSSAASTSSNGKQKTSKKKAMKKADNFISDLSGVADASSRIKGKEKSKAPKKKKSTKSLEDDFGANLEECSVLDDGVSCLTENSKSTMGTSTSPSKSKSKKKKKRSPSKNSSKVHAINENSPTNESVGSKRSKSHNKKKAKQISSSGSKHDDDISTSSQTSSSRRSKAKRRDPSKLNKRDRLYHSNSTNSATSPYHSRGDDEISKNSLRRANSLPTNGRTSKGLSSLAKKKNVNSFGRDGSAGLKILTDGSIKASAPKRSSSVDKNHVFRAHQIDQGSDSDSVSLSDSSDEDRVSSRRRTREKLDRRKTLDRSTSLQQVRDMALVTKKSYAPASSSTGASRGPIRMAARGNSPKIRSVSADHVRDMQRHLARNPSNQSLVNSRNAGNPNSKNVRLYVAPSPREAPLRRGVGRNASAPLRSAIRSPSFSGQAPNQRRGQLRNTESAYFHQTQRRPLARQNSKDLSAAEHVEMLRGLRENFDYNNRRQRSSSQPRGDQEGMPKDSRRGRRDQAQGSLSPKRGILRNNSHRSDCSFSSKGSYGRSALLHQTSKSDLDPGDIEDSIVINRDNEDYEIEHESLNDSRHRRDISRSKRRASRNSSEKSFLGISTHSVRSIQSNRSQMSIDKQEEFENDPRWKAILRYIHILPPYKNEPKLKKKTRIFTWIAMLLDFIVAVVAVAQYQGSTTCCGDPVFDIIMDINWDGLFRGVTILYLFMIPAEIVPVIKYQIPCNIVNPGIGMIITFGMFFDDSIAEAVAMWVIEALAIFMEFMVYRVNARMFFETSFKLKQVDEEIEKLKKKRKEFIERLQDGEMPLSGSMHGSRHGGGSRHDSEAFSRHSRGRSHSRGGSLSRDRSRSNDLEMGRGKGSFDDDDSLSGNSFGGDDDFDDEVNSPLTHTIRSRQLRRTKSRDALGSSTHPNGASTTITGITGMAGRIRLPGEIKQNKLLRKRRILRENKQTEAKDLHYHFIASVLNVGLAVIAIIFIITIASTGGLCFKGNEINVFSFQQLQICDKIDTTIYRDRYEYCEDPEEPQCYIPYY